MVRPRFTMPEHAIVTCYLAGDTVTYLAKILGVDRSVIRRVLEDNDVTLRDDRGRRPNHWTQGRAA